MIKIKEKKLELEDELDLPEYITIKDKKKLIIRAGSDWEGYKNHNISVADVIFYYHRDARNISSGYRFLGTIGGD